MLLALIMATLTLGLLFSGWFTPTPTRAQGTGGGNPQANQENTNSCSGTTYDPATQGCCNGTVYNLATQGCCNGTVYDLATQGCCTHCTFNPDTQTVACTYTIYNLATQGCCGGTVYDLATQCCAPDGSVVDKLTISDLSKCPNKTTRPPPYVPTANGCGAATGPSSITPNCPALITAPACYVVGINWCFTDPCNAHDRGYGTCNTSKDDTDQQFYNDMTDVCDNLAPSSSLCRAACRADAAIYYDAVHYGGQSAYDDAQKAACICCP
jgi:hypothetical protein